MKNDVFELQPEGSVVNGRIIVSFRNTKYFLPVKRILRIEGSGMYTVIYSKRREQYICTKNLKVFEQVLEEEYFFRAHKSHLINMREVKGFRDGGRSGNIIMSDNYPVEVSCRKKPVFLKLFSDLRGRNLI